MNSYRKLYAPAIAASLVGSLALAGCASQTQSSSTSSTKSTTSAQSSSFQVFSWLTAGSEKAALDVLVKDLQKDDPELKIVSGAAAGAGGANAQAVLRTRLAGGNIPNTWQATAGEQVKTYQADGVIGDVTSELKANGEYDHLPTAILDGMKSGSNVYGLPIDIQRGNEMWYNPSVLKKAGVTLSPTTTYPQFVTDLAKIKASGVSPFCVGDTGSSAFGSSVIFESVLLANLTPTQWNDIFSGKLAWTAAPVKRAVADYVNLLQYYAPGSTSVDWSGAAADMAAGKCAVNVMGDWEYAQLANIDGYTPIKDFNYMPLPGSQGVFDDVSDIFVMSKAAVNTPAGKAWIKVMSDPVTQVAFNEAKGAIPPRTDADVSSMSAYQQESAKDYRSDQIAKVFSLQAGEIASPKYVTAFQNALISLNANHNVTAFLNAMSTAASGD